MAASSQTSVHQLFWERNDFGQQADGYVCEFESGAFCIYYLHIVQSTSAQAVDTLAVVGTNNDIRQGRAVLEEEDGIRVTTLCLFATRGWATIVLIHAAVEAGPRCNSLDRRGDCGTGRLGKSRLQIGIGGGRMGCDHHGEKSSEFDRHHYQICGLDFEGLSGLGSLCSHASSGQHMGRFIFKYRGNSGTIYIGSGVPQHEIDEHVVPYGIGDQV